MSRIAPTMGHCRRAALGSTSLLLMLALATQGCIMEDEPATGSVDVNVLGGENLGLDQATLRFDYMEWNPATGVYEPSLRDSFSATFDLDPEVVGYDINLLLGTGMGRFTAEVSSQGVPVASGSTDVMEIHPGDNRVQVALTTLLGDAAVGFEIEGNLLESAYVANQTGEGESLTLTINAAELDGSYDPSALTATLTIPETGMTYPFTADPADPYTMTTSFQVTWTQDATLDVTVSNGVDQGRGTKTCVGEWSDVTDARALEIEGLLEQNSDGTFKLVPDSAATTTVLTLDQIQRINAAIQSVNNDMLAQSYTISVADATPLFAMQAAAVGPIVVWAGRFVQALIKLWKAIQKWRKARAAIKAANKAKAAVKAAEAAKKSTATVKALKAAAAAAAALAAEASVEGLVLIAEALVANQEAQLEELQKPPAEQDKDKLEALKKQRADLKAKEKDLENKIKELQKN